MLDNDAGLYYYSARWYEPVVGKFITPDTIIQAPYDPQSLNRYAYARNNPVKYVDPTGNYFGEGVVNAIASFFSSLFGGNGSSQTGTSSSGDSKVFEGKKAPEGTVETTATTPTITSEEGKKSSIDQMETKTDKIKGEKEKSKENEVKQQDQKLTERENLLKRHQELKVKLFNDIVLHYMVPGAPIIALGIIVAPGHPIVGGVLIVGGVALEVQGIRGFAGWAQDYGEWMRDYQEFRNRELERTK